jgi:ribonuclease HII
MLVYAGIDEAGYGPLFGPLVIARSVFVLEREEPSLEPPSMWKLLQSSVCKKPGDKKKRLAVNDSKKLYTPARSPKHLERGVLSFLSASGKMPKNLEDLLENMAYDPPSSKINLAWYQAPAGESLLPSGLPSFQLDKAKKRLQRAMLNNAVRLADLRAAVVFEDRFNQMVRTLGSKAGCAWTFVSGHLEYIWSRFGKYHPLVVVDRQGGRKNYKELLDSVFFPAESNTLWEDPRKSCYRITSGVRQMDILFLVDSERRHFPVALASMAAKYLRELLMARFQNFWSVRAPDVKPTFGYFGDGRRFLREIQPLLTQLGTDPQILIRCC